MVLVIYASTCKLLYDKVFAYKMQKDGRIPSHAGFTWSVSSDVESVEWDPHTEYSFVVRVYYVSLYIFNFIF